VGLPCEKWQQRPATKRRSHPSRKAVANVQRCWGRRETKLPVRRGSQTAKLGMPFHRHGFMTNWGMEMVVGIIYNFSSVDMYQKN